MIEVKSSTSVKDYHRDDAAIQAFVTKGAGVPLAPLLPLARIHNQWVYPAAQDDQGLLVENDLTEAVLRQTEGGERMDSRRSLNLLRISALYRNILALAGIAVNPMVCGFIDYCQSKEKQAKYPVTWIPRIQTAKLKSAIETGGLTDMRDFLMKADLTNGSCA